MFFKKSGHSCVKYLLENKQVSRINIIQKLASLTCGRGAQMVWTATLALVYSMAECYAPVWGRSSHTDLNDIQLNVALRLVSGTLKATPLPWIPVLANILSPTIW